MNLTKDEFYCTPLYVRSMRIPSRFFLAPINTGYTENGSPTEELLKFHALRSGRKIGISYVGNVAIGTNFRSNNSTALLEGNLSQWGVVTSTISKNGSLPGIQLGCKASKIPSIREWVNNNPNKYLALASQEFNNYSTEFLESIIELYVKSAEQAYRCGFKVIQIHAAHGYFLSLSISSSINNRTDKYGEDKGMLVSTIIKRIRDVLPEVILDVRISLLEGIQSAEKEIKEKRAIIKVLCNSGLDIISVSSGIYNINKNLIYPSKDIGIGPYVELVLPYAELYPSLIWNVAGNMYDLEVVRPMTKNNLTYSIGRPLIADYSFVEKYSSSNVDSVRRCKWCGKCHYYSNGAKSMAACLGGESG